MLPNSAHFPAAASARWRRPSTPGGLTDRIRAQANARRPQLLERLAIDIGDQVAEAIDAAYFAGDAIGPDTRLRELDAMNLSGGAAEGGQFGALGEPCRRRRKPIAPFEGPADGRTRIAAFGQFDHPPGRRLVEDDAEHAVVGADEFVLARLAGNPPARRATPGSTTTRNTVPGGK